ncbi:hypothetical protein Tco_0894587 [Tanacetum coccineum]|uniref:Uncharacterized protein n=1 Tax=Tanacetum coccineum TaxID=301880 RepID=A0ABQ5CCJ8_9ASTR
MFPLRLLGKAPGNSTIFLNTKTSLNGLSSTSLDISTSLVDQLCRRSDGCILPSSWPSLPHVQSISKPEPSVWLD